VSAIEPRRARRGRRRTRDRVARALIVLVLFLLVFLLGIAFSRALDEQPERGDLVTDVRTLTPMEQQAPARTVTVTVTTP
jgi:uncharacterized iron-regulated membrane protein